MTLKYLLLSMLLLALRCGAAEEMPTPYGLRVLRVEALPAAPAPETEAAAAALAREDRERLAERIEALERRSGPYAAELEEPLYQLARDALERGLYAEAERLFRRGLHVLRVNEGLYSRRQEELVRLLLRSLRERGDYSALDGQYSYLFRLAGAGQPPWTEARRSAILDVLDWRREAILRGLGDQERRLYDFQSDCADLREQVAAAAEPAPGFEAELVLCELDALYLILDRIQPLLESPFDQRLVARPRTDIGAVDLQRERLDDLYRRAPQAGDQLIEDFLERRPEADDETRWRLRLALGDWQRFSGRWRSAAETWDLLSRDLAAAGREDLREAWWGEPVELPAGGVYRVAGEVEVRGRGRYRLTVDERGNSRAVELLDREGGEDSALIGLTRDLRELVFRPHMSGGERRERVIERRYARLEAPD